MEERERLESARTLGQEEREQRIQSFKLNQLRQKVRSTL